MTLNDLNDSIDTLGDGRCCECDADWQANFADVVRDLAKQWHELSDEDWKSYKCKCKRRKPSAPGAQKSHRPHC